MRLFIAIPLPQEVRQWIIKLQHSLNVPDAGPWMGRFDGRWTAAENLHITIKFLGQMPDAVAASLADSLRRIDFGPAPHLQLGPLVLLPKRGAVRIVGNSVIGEVERLRALAAAVDQACCM